MDDKNCSNCPQGSDCKQIYQKMGDAQGPSVVSKVIVAFVLSIVVFIFSLVVFGKLLGDKITGAKLATAIVFALSLIVTLIYIFLVKKAGDRKQKTE